MKKGEGGEKGVGVTLRGFSLTPKGEGERTEKQKRQGLKIGFRCIFIYYINGWVGDEIRCCGRKRGKWAHVPIPMPKPRKSMLGVPRRAGSLRHASYFLQLKGIVWM